MIKLRLRAKRAYRKIGRALGGWYWPVMLPLTILLYKIARAAAIAERGNTAVGGELLLLLFPLYIPAVVTAMKDFFRQLMTGEDK